jgi:hypothetical protein
VGNESLPTFARILLEWESLKIVLYNIRAALVHVLHCGASPQVHEHRRQSLLALLGLFPTTQTYTGTLPIEGRVHSDAPQCVS